MINGKKVIVVMPAYNAAKTLEKTISEVDRSYIDDLLLVDDASKDDTLEVCRRLNIRSFVHDSNFGYGRNQKTCYTEALGLEPDIIIMLHPDYQYTPRLLLAMASMIAYGTYDVVLASRILGGTALSGGMPLYKYIFNRILTLVQNLLMGTKVSEFHTGYRAFSADALRRVPFQLNSDNFLFDNEMLAQLFYSGARVGEVSCPTVYEPESSSIRFWPSVRYGLGVLWTSVRFFLQRRGWASFTIFKPIPAEPLSEEYYRTHSS